MKHRSVVTHRNALDILRHRAPPGQPLVVICPRVPFKRAVRISPFSPHRKQMLRMREQGYSRAEIADWMEARVGRRPSLANTVKLLYRARKE
jgi:hypothetical protein